MRAPRVAASSSRLFLPGLLCGLFFVLAAAASAYGSDGEAGQPDEFLRYGIDVRSLGMGRANVALADDASAAYYNPAGLLRLRRGFLLSGMHFSPFYESRFSALSIAAARPDRRATGLKGFLFGPASAWSLSFVQLSSEGYEQRDAADNLIDDEFGLYQQAFMLGFAREATGSAGILGLGATLKVIRQGVSDATGRYDKAESGFGLDLGAQLQMINPPLLKGLTRVPLIGPFFRLKHLMPLRLGLSIRNVISPKVGYGGTDDKYPTSMRLGAAYTLPSDWLLRDSRITLVSDFEWLYADIDRLIRLDRRVEVHDVAPGAGQYFGAEFQYRSPKVQLAPRFGLGHVFDEWEVSTGLGVVLRMPSFDVQIDFAQGFHDVLADDQRVAVTIRFGGERDSRYYYADARTQTSLSPKADCLHALTDYPDNLGLVRFARDTLANTLDTLNRMRYLELFIDLSLGDYWYERARYELEYRQPGMGLSAQEATDAYATVHRDPTVVFSDKALLNEAESWSILAVAAESASDARRCWERVLGMASQLPRDSLRAVYLLGVAAEAVGDTVAAVGHFEHALGTTGADARSMRLLSRLELGRCLLATGRADSGLAALRTLFGDPNSTTDSLAEHYPRFPEYSDRRLADDALAIVAKHIGDIGPERAREALLLYGNICRFYPGSDKCRDVEVEQRVSDLVRQLSE